MKRSTSLVWIVAGENKALLDPFMPVDKTQQVHVQKMLDTIHVQFINAVKAGRGERLDAEAHPEVFSGLFWTGEEALALGLIDGLKSPGQVAREVIGYEEMEDFTARRHPLDEFFRNFGMSVGTGIAESLGMSGASLR